ncbi:PREDICTED: MATH and LRR domain-containing protein PFE0570w-like [Lupinus angustifolius]|uniref:MATH and LRR domain-containing protein PFE0570w-like n=1 Tax=Lupinus angustifolius TaxID=3871 RepID=UPI00092EA129|nr:PREDICTED: MATH and LRR domain-containing protein PFE0570w-like [Lupinus angustifolius]
MTPLMYLGFKKVLFLYLLFLFVSLCFSAYSEPQLESKNLSSIGTIRSNIIRRKMLELGDDKEEEFEQPLKKKSTKNNTKLINPNNTNKLSSKNQTKGIKSNNNLSSKNQTKTIKSNNNLSTKNQTKLAKFTSKTTLTYTHEVKIKKLNSTTIKTNKLNSTTKLKPFTNSSKSSINPFSTSSNSTKSKSLDLLKTTSGNNKTTKATTTTKDKDKDKDKKNKLDLQTQSTSKKNKENKKQGQPSWMFELDEDNLDFSELKDLPIKFQQTLLPDLDKISKTSKAYITKANEEITKGFKPYVGNKYAPTIASLLSCAFALIPLLFVSLLFSRIKSYFSLQKLLIFIQAYLSIYFFILSLSSLITGLEPLKFFYATSQSTYLCLQVLQTLAYVFYLMLLLMYLVLVFSTDCELSSRFLGLAQTFVGFSIGLHYYVRVFHRVVSRQGPRTNWKMHGIYGMCFFLICIFANAERRKKSYLEEGGEEGKKN